MISATTLNVILNVLGLALTGGALGIFLKYRLGIRKIASEDRESAHKHDIEGRSVTNAEMAAIIADYAKRQAETRKEVHDLKNEVANLIAAQLVRDKEHLELKKMLTHALATSSMRKSQMDNMMSLIELLIAELSRIDPDSIIVPQAKTLLQQMRESADRVADPILRDDPNKSAAMNSAEGAVTDAKQTLASTKATCEEVKHSEGGK